MSHELGRDFSSRMISDGCVVESGSVFPLLKMTRRCPAKVMYFLDKRTLAQHLDVVRCVRRED